MTFPSIAQVGSTGPIYQHLVGAFRSPEMNFAPMAAPPIPVAQASGTIKSLGSAPFMRTDAKKRAPGAPYPEKEFTVSEISFTTVDWSVRAPIPREIIGGSVRNLKADKLGARLVAEDLATRWMLEIAAYTLTTTWGSGSTHEMTPSPKWDTSTGLPQTDVLIGHRYIHGRIHRKANTLILGYSAYMSLLTNPQITGILGTNQPKIVTDELLKVIFKVENLVVAEANYVTSVQGQTDTFAPIIDKVALLAYIEQNPDPETETPSALHTLFWDRTVGPEGTPSMNNGILLEAPWYDDARKRFMYDAAAQFSVKQMNADAGYLFLAVCS